MKSDFPVPGGPQNKKFLYTPRFEQVFDVATAILVNLSSNIGYKSKEASICIYTYTYIQTYIIRIILITNYY